MSKLLRRAKVKLCNAINDYEKISEDDAYLDDCCYNLQQAIEMSLKFIVEMHGELYAENHDIRAQLNKLGKLGISVPYCTELRNMAVTLNSWEAESRYKDSFLATLEEIDNAMIYVKALIRYSEENSGKPTNAVPKIDSF